MPAPACTYAVPPRHDDRADRDAEVEVAGEVEIADGAGVEPAARRLELPDDLHRPHLRRARHGAGRKARHERVEPIAIRRPACPSTIDARCITCEKRSSPMNCGTRTDPVLADAADVVAAEIDEHDVLGALLLVALQLLGQPHVLFVVAPARPRARNRVRLDARPFDAHQHLRRRADDRHAAHPDEIHVGRRIDVPQRAVDGERIGVDVGLEALRQHDLVDVAGGDVLLRRAHLLLELLARVVRAQRRAPPPARGCACDRLRSSSRSRN